MCFCNDCGAVSEEAETVSYCKEEYNGVADIFGRATWGTYAACPECGSDDVDIVNCDYECEDCIEAERCPERKTEHVA